MINSATEIKQGEKPKCKMCYYVRMFALIAFFITLLLVLLLRIPSIASIGF